MVEFIPKFFTILRSYSWTLLKKDLFAGISVSIIALPLAMAFAIASGVTPERGLTTAIVAGFCVSLFGGSKVQIAGPTGAFAVIIYDVVQKGGYEGLATATMMAAVILVLFGVFRLGSLIRYVPHSLITGFTSGIAVMIFSSQMKDFFGLQIENLPARFAQKWMAYFEHLGTVHFPTLLLGAASLAAIYAIRKFLPKLPWAITAIACATALAYLFDLPVETIQSKFGSMPNHLPSPQFPIFTWVKCFDLLGSAIAIAFLAGIESLLSAVVGDRMSGGRHRSNCELIGQGIANFASVLFGGIPATGAISRTAANVKMGGQTPVSGMIHALSLLLIVYSLAPLASLIPLTALASVLIVLSLTMMEPRRFLHQIKSHTNDGLVLLTAFFLTVFVDVSAAVILGMVLASFLFMRRITQSSKAVRHDGVLPEGTFVYDMHGPLFFGTSHILPSLDNAKVLILNMRHVPLIDASGMNALRDLLEKCQKEKVRLLLSGVHGHAEHDLNQSKFKEKLGANAIFHTVEEALKQSLCKLV